MPAHILQHFPHFDPIRLLRMTRSLFASEGLVEGLNVARSVVTSPGDGALSGNDLAQWRFVEKLGGGRWATVYRAQPASRGDDQPADYAIKLAKTTASDDDSLSLNMLRLEAALGRSIGEPHLAPVFDARLAQTPYYLVMPFLAGASADRAVEFGGPFCGSFALWIARQVAQALEQLHAAGWRHGDVKPHNIMVSPEGHATLIDLGFAAPIVGKPGPDKLAFAGSLAYTAPECFCIAKSADGLSDVYSLGATLFELLTGQQPYIEESIDQLAAAHLTAPPPDIRRLAPHVSGRVARLVKRLLSKEPMRRPSASELVELLSSLEIELLSDRIPA